MATVVEYKDRLSTAMQEAGVTTADLAAALGISYQAVRKVLQLGGQFGKDNNAAAARVLKVRSDWLATGRGPRALTAEARFSDDLRQKVLTLSDDALYRLETVMRAHLGMNQTPLSVVANSRQFGTDGNTLPGHHRAPEDGAGLPEDVALPPAPKHHDRSSKDRRRASPKGGRGA